MRVFCHLIGKGCYKASLKNKTKQTSDWSSHKALIVSESWMFVRGCSAFLRARTETWRASLLTGGGKKEGSKGGEKRELLHLSRWQTWEGYRMEKKGWRNPYTSGSCLVPCWTALVNWLCKFLSSLLCSALPLVCMPALLLWSWLPFVAYFFGRVNLISRHPSSSTASRVDYETFTAARLGTALEQLPEFAHKQPAWHSSGTTPGEGGRGQTSTSPSFQLSQLKFPCRQADDPQYTLKPMHKTSQPSLWPHSKECKSQNLSESSDCFYFWSENIYKALKTSEPHQKPTEEMLFHTANSKIRG